MNSSFWTTLWLSAVYCRLTEMLKSDRPRVRTNMSIMRLSVLTDTQKTNTFYSKCSCMYRIELVFFRKKKKRLASKIAFNVQFVCATKPLGGYFFNSQWIHWGQEMIFLIMIMKCVNWAHDLIYSLKVILHLLRMKSL